MCVCVAVLAQRPTVTARAMLTLTPQQRSLLEEATLVTISHCLVNMKLTEQSQRSTVKRRASCAAHSQVAIIIKLMCTCVWSWHISCCLFCGHTQTETVFRQQSFCLGRQRCSDAYRTSTLCLLSFVRTAQSQHWHETSLLRGACQVTKRMCVCEMVVSCEIHSRGKIR